MTSEEIAARLRAAIEQPSALLYGEDAEYVLRTAARMVEGYQEFLDKTEWVQMEYLEGAGFPGAAGKHRADLLEAEIMRLRAELAQHRKQYTYYLTRAKAGFVELRQTRYREMWEAGEEVPDDVCLVANSKQHMRQLTTGWKGSIDWSSIPEDE